MKALTGELTIEFEQDGLEVRGGEWGSMHVSQYTLPAGTDLSPFFVGLPDDLCTCNHWGRVLDGEIHLRYGDGSEETTRAGEVYYWPAGHTAWTEDGVVFLAITPLDEERRMEELLQAATG
jgi:hypothetical protein